MKMKTYSVHIFAFLVVYLFFITEISIAKRVGETDIDAYRDKVKRMFYHAYDSYLIHAYPYDELQPLTCQGMDTWGSYSLTLIDALDTLAVMGNFSEFRRVSDIIISKGESFFDIDINVSVFETNIRIVGGLLSAHLMMKRAGMVVEPGWPCSGPLLRMAESAARKILPAFDTPTGMPYGTVNLRYGVPKGETTITCTAGVGTFLVEFGSLSRLIGDPVFEKTAMRAIRALWKYRSPIGLLGNHIDVSNGKWTAMDSGVGGGIDSYFEYLVKGAVMFNMPELIHMFREYEAALNKHVKRDDWYMWAHMTKGSITMPMFTSLDGYWPSIKGMLGDLDQAMKTMHNFHQVWRQFGFTPEYYNIPKAEAHKGREGYPLRPEIVESAMYLYRATKDPYLLEIGVDILESIEYSARTSCGYATVKDVRDHRLDDRMESFFLAETTKYLYLLFDPDNWIHNNGSHGDLINTPNGRCVIEAGGYVFNTEAHPIDLAAVHCCSSARKEDDQILQDFHDNLDLLALFDLDDKSAKEAWLRGKGRNKRNKNKNVGGKQNIQQKLANKPIDDHEDTNKYIKEIMKEYKVEMNGFVNNISSSSKPKSHKQENKQMNVDNDSMKILTTKVVHEPNLDDVLKDISSELKQKLEESFEESDIVEVAQHFADKIIKAAERTFTNKNIDSVEQAEEQFKKDSLVVVNIDVGVSEQKDSVIESGNKSPDEESLVVVDIEGKIVDGKDVMENEEEKSSPDSESVLTEDEAKSSVANTKVEKFKIYLEELLKQHGLQDVEDEEEEEEEEDKINHIEPWKNAPTKSLQPKAYLENKRQSLLSITKRLIGMISGLTRSKEEAKMEEEGPSLAGLYKALSEYPVTYFKDPATMHCKAQAFHQRVSVNGEMFPDDDDL